MTAKRTPIPKPSPALTPDRGDDWRESASCRGTVDDWRWFDHGQRDEAKALAEARRACWPCPVREACLGEALADLNLEGIWAGTTQQERRRIARNRDRKTRAKEATA